MKLTADQKCHIYAWNVSHTRTWEVGDLFTMPEADNRTVYRIESFGGVNRTSATISVAGEVDKEWDTVIGHGRWLYIHPDVVRFDPVQVSVEEFKFQDLCTPCGLEAFDGDHAKIQVDDRLMVVSLFQLRMLEIELMRKLPERFGS